MLYTVYLKSIQDKFEAKVYLGLPMETSNPVFQYVKKNGVLLNLASLSTMTSLRIPAVAPAPRPAPVIFTSAFLLGGSQQETAPNYTAAPYPAIFTQIRGRFPTFVETLVRKVAIQVVAGQIYTIDFNLPADTANIYSAKTFVPLPSSNESKSILSLTKNGVAIA